MFLSGWTAFKYLPGSLKVPLRYVPKQIIMLSVFLRICNIVSNLLYFKSFLIYILKIV